jgi:hypothetical protein
LLNGKYTIGVEDDGVEAVADSIGESRSKSDPDTRPSDAKVSIEFSVRMVALPTIVAREYPWAIRNSDIREVGKTCLRPLPCGESVRIMMVLSDMVLMI